MSRKSTAQSIAIGHLDAAISRARDTGTARLPVLGSLAANAGVCRVTMWRALQVLRERGVIVISRGRGIRVADMVRPQLMPPTAPPIPRIDGEYVARQMVADLLSRQMDPARTLPSTKDLMRRYAVTYHTMRNALTILHADGTLTGNRRVNADLAQRSGNATIVLIATGYQGTLRRVTSRTADHIHQAELACASMGVRLKFLPLDEPSVKSPPSLKRAMRALGDTDPATGYVIWSIGIGGLYNLVPLINQLLLSGKRVSLLNESEGGQRSLFKDPHKSLRIWCMAISTRSSQSMARHLLVNGHHNVAYLTPFAPEQRPDARLTGLRQGFAAAGINNAVHACNFGLSDELVGGDALGALYNLNRTIKEFQINTAPDGYLDWKMRQPANRDNPVTIRMAYARRMLKQIDTESRGPGLFDAHLRTLLKQPEITAWVANNDIVAAECVEFLRRHPRTTRNITIVGFDDGELASHFGFTSYNFNGQAVMRAMVHHALGNPLPKSPVDKNGAEEIPGFVNVRIKPVGDD